MTKADAAGAAFRALVRRPSIAAVDVIPVPTVVAWVFDSALPLALVSSTISMAAGRFSVRVKKMRVWCGLFSGGVKRFNAFCIFGFKILLRHFQVVMGLKVHPKFWAIAKVQAQPKRCVSCDAPPIVDNLGNAVW